MENKLQERSVYQPRELQILETALLRASRLIEEKYGYFGGKLQTIQLVAATAIFELAKTGDLQTDNLVEAAAESVRVFLTRASDLRAHSHPAVRRFN